MCVTHDLFDVFALNCYFVFFKQKTAYEMRISDWISDVCSSDLLRDGGGEKPSQPRTQLAPAPRAGRCQYRRRVADEIRRQGSRLRLRLRLSIFVRMMPSKLRTASGYIVWHEFQFFEERYESEHCDQNGAGTRSEEHTSELQSLMRISYA